ncbi:hypothetical protein [Terribacillus saccharophilus]|uniref:hypothetical protein n=1 Tax=Terribacillus saccharophilus TaxID=361277 RepID=UPI003D271AB9
MKRLKSVPKQWRSNGEAMAKHQDVILREKLIDIMPDYARAINESFSNVESIRLLGMNQAAVSTPCQTP